MSAGCGRNRAAGHAKWVLQKQRTCGKVYANGEFWSSSLAGRDPESGSKGRNARSKSDIGIMNLLPSSSPVNAGQPLETQFQA